MQTPISTDKYIKIPLVIQFSSSFDKFTFRLDTCWEKGLESHGEKQIINLLILNLNIILDLDDDNYFHYIYFNKILLSGVPAL
jgi:hypothetical protein